METQVPLIVRPVDLNDDDTVEQLAVDLAVFAWQETAGQVVATVFAASSDPVAAASAAVLCIRRVLRRPRWSASTSSSSRSPTSPRGQD
ncbi:hypothetical protein ACFUJY_25160 [Streptomyces sp. NPDC057249]|uniref:hypothetical protein n=1 Tax=Streptomyces sp. NPDC057249 TaxID=3346067 RepID=UPI00363F067E